MRTNNSKAGFPFPLQRSLVLLLAASTTLAFASRTMALESETVSAFALRAEKNLASGKSMDLQFTSRWQQDFQQPDRSIFQLTLGKEMQHWEFSTAYHQQFDRSTPGKEHRLWQQARYSFALPSGTLESSARLEERYFTTTHKSGSRLRIYNRWSQPVTPSDTLRLGYEWVYNLKDLAPTTLQGISQNRLISGISHRLPSGKRVEFEYQLRYLHIPAADNRIQHQFQLSYSFSL